MKITDLEASLLLKVYEIKRLDKADLLKSLDDIDVAERDLTGVGFFTTFKRHACLKIASDDRDYRWSGLGAILNKDRTQVGFLLYVEKGYLVTIEGYTYGGESWPDRIVFHEIVGYQLIDPEYDLP